MFGKGSGKLETIIGSGTNIAGKVSVEGTIRVDGIVEGDIQADWVVVGETGRIRGNARARGMVVGGSVEGNMEATEIVELKEKATITGEISTPRLAVSEGAVFHGRSRMNRETDSAVSPEGNVRALNPTRTAI